MEQPGKVQHGPTFLLEREVRKSRARAGSWQNPPAQNFQVENKGSVQEKDLVRFTPWLRHSTLAVLLDPDLLLLDLRNCGLGNHRAWSSAASDQGTDMMQGALEEIKYGSLPLRDVVQAFIQGFAVSAGVHKEYMELDMFENMSVTTQTHAPTYVNSSVCPIYLKYSFMREIQAFRRGVAFQESVFTCVNSALHMRIQILI